MWRRVLCDWCNKHIEKDHETVELDHHLFHTKPTDCAEAYRDYCRDKMRRVKDAVKTDKPN